MSNLVKDKLTLLLRACADGLVTDTEFRHLFALLCQFHNGKSGKCFPTDADLGRAAGGKCRRWVGAQTRSLQDKGYLTKSRTRYASNYTFPGISSDVTASSYLTSDPDVTDRASRCDRTVTPDVTQECRTEPLKQPLNKPLNKRACARECDLAFDEWWKLYPNKQGKLAAQKLYQRIVTKGTATVDQLLSGIKRYAATCQDKEAKYIKHPTTWLNAGCWADKSVPKKGRYNASGYSVRDVSTEPPKPKKSPSESQREHIAGLEEQLKRYLSLTDAERRTRRDDYQQMIEADLANAREMLKRIESDPRFNGKGA